MLYKYVKWFMWMYVSAKWYTSQELSFLSVAQISNPSVNGHVYARALCYMEICSYQLMLTQIKLNVCYLL